MPLHIAVTGASGKGKSSFINALRGLTELDPGAAKVDVKECTRKLTAYRHPELDNFVIWDIPGVGTKSFPQESYLEEINVDRYDFFIIVTTERFTDLDAWLMSEVKNRKKRLYVLRTKIDIDIANEKRKTRGPFDENKAFIELKKEFLKEMIESMNGESDFQFFVISNHFTLQYDFPHLELQLMKDVPIEKKTAMVFGVAGMSKDVVEEKAKALRSRIWKIAVLSGVGAAIPIPFLSSSIDVAIILEEVLFYRSQFALDDSSLGKLAEMCDVSLDKLKEKVSLETPAVIFSTGGLTQFLSKYVATEAVEKLVQFTIPVIGTIIGCGISYTTTSEVLSLLLEMMKGDALKVLEFVAYSSAGTKSEEKE